MQIAVYLIEHGANVNIQGGILMETPLHWSVRKNFFRVAKLLVDSGANMSIKSNMGLDVLHLACQLGIKSLIFLLCSLIDRHLYIGDLEMIFLLLSWGANPNTFNEAGDTPILSLLKEDRPPIHIIRLLLRMGADVGIQNPVNGNTPLHHICLKRNQYKPEVIFLMFNATGSDSAQLKENNYHQTPYQV
jgi:ankyrin repeat protein